MKYQVAEYIIDTARYRISSGDAVIPAEPKVFDLLVYLLRHRERVLSREELFREVWDGREVSDATLSNHVKSARRILGDSGELQKTIQTIRGRGYQFTAPVTVIPEGSASTGDDKAAEPQPATTHVAKPVAPAWRSPLVIAGVLLLAALLGWYTFASFQSRPVSDVPYVVVVPFDVSGDAPEAWRPFADQVTREVIRALKKISGLRVVPTPSAFTFKDNKARDHILRQLPDVQYVLDGVVSISADNTLRITAELEDLNTGLLVWDNDYEGRTSDTNLFAMQSSIAAAVADSLRVAILADEQRALGELPTTDLKAYELYVAGRQQMELYSHESQRRAIELFDQAIAQDPQFFDAYVARGGAYRTLFGYFEPPINLLPAVVSSLSEALELRPGSAEVLSSLGLSYVMAWRWKDAWVVLNEAQARDPTLALTELGFALYYSGLGNGEKVKSSLAAANRLDPLNAEVADWGEWALLMVGEGAAARAWGEEKMRQHPNVGMIFSSACTGFYMAGDHARAVALAKRGAELERSATALIMLAQAYGYAGQKEQVQPLLDEAASMGTYTCPYESAVAYLTIGETERAFSLLNEAVEKRSNCLMFLRNDPRMEVLHPDPRYQNLLTRVGLDDLAVRSYKQ
jgi:DNA-binding winged helix-turn-helix (wHTH) protein/TolB-like protein/tetratricopeptide (TPR) repeat protein